MKRDKNYCATCAHRYPHDKHGVFSICNVGFGYPVKLFTGETTENVICWDNIACDKWEPIKCTFAYMRKSAEIKEHLQGSAQHETI